MPDGHPAQKRGSGETEAEEVISVETEKRKVCWVRSGRMKRMTRASTQAKPSVGKTKGVFLGTPTPRPFQVKDADDQADSSPMEQLTPGAHTSEHREDRADEESCDEVPGAQALGCANVTTPCGYATDQFPQSIEKSSAWWGDWSAY
jgi:hypothetical protein